LNKFAKKEVKVALNGDGGDELFAGYDTFGALRIAELYNKLTPKFLHKKISCLANLLPNSTSNMSFDFKLKKALAGLNYNQNLWHPTWLSTLNLEQIKDLFNANVKEEELYSEAIELWNRNQDLNLIDKSSEFYVNFYLPGNILPKSDQASMLNSIESRAVFLDKEIAEFSMRLPSHFKLKNNCKKYILKKLLQKKLPQEIINRKKKGFGVPISKWLTDFPKTMPLNQAFFEIYGQAPQINQNVAVKLWHQHQNKQKDHRLFMWSWMILQGFLEK
jgi:asparagine synthase (glutamine-hydrolysing)